MSFAKIERLPQSQSTFAQDLALRQGRAKFALQLLRLSSITGCCFPTVPIAITVHPIADNLPG